MARKQWQEKEIQFLKENYGIISLKEISKILDRSIASIKYKAERENIKSAREWTEEELEYLKSNYKEMTNKELAEHLNRSKAAVDLKINRLGLSKEKYHYNRNFFKEISTEEQAYWCGFIMADGCVSSISKINSCELSIKLQAGDAEHLRKFNKALNGNIPVAFTDHFCEIANPPRILRIAQIRLYSEAIFHDLEKYGVIPNKSLIKQFPQNISNKLMRHYIRGYFDGNGCITLSGSKNTQFDKRYIICSFYTGSKDFAEGLLNYLHQVEIKTSAIYTTNDKNTCFVVRIAGLQNVDKFLHFLYDDSTIYLERKFQKKNKLYEITCMSERLLRQSEKAD